LTLRSSPSNLLDSKAGKGKVSAYIPQLQHPKEAPKLGCVNAENRKTHTSDTDASELQQQKKGHAESNRGPKDANKETVSLESQYQTDAPLLENRDEKSSKKTHHTSNPTREARKQRAATYSRSDRTPADSYEGTVSKKLQHQNDRPSASSIRPKATKSFTACGVKLPCRFLV
jgi:hypothetical protein